MNFTATSAQADKISFLTFLDSDNSWDSVYKTKLTCEEKVKKAKSNTSIVSNEPIPIIFNDNRRAHFW